jgi:hypothetical protein
VTETEKPVTPDVVPTRWTTEGLGIYETPYTVWARSAIGYAS